LSTQTKENNYNTNIQNECNLSQSEEKNSELTQMSNNAYDKKTKQMTSYNKNINIINNNNNKINNNNQFSISIENNCINNLNKSTNNFTYNNYNKHNINSHKRTYSEVLDNNTKKSEFGFNNNGKLLNLTNTLSNSKEFADPTEKINKIRELSLGKYMHVFTDVDNDKSNASYLSSRKNSRINDTINQTDGDLSSCRLNKISPHYSQVNKFNFQGFFNPNEILKNLNSNVYGNNEIINNKNNEMNDTNNLVVSNFSLQNKNNNHNANKNLIDNNDNNNNINNSIFCGNNFKSKNYTPNSFRVNNTFNTSAVSYDNKIKNIFS
jgi:hypothetical protein